MTVAVVAEGLVRAYGPVRALDRLDLEVARGSVCAVLGPNGAGKTTAIRVLATLTVPDAGRAAVLGHDVVRDAAAVRASIGLAGQHAAVDDDLTGRENLEILGRMQHLGRRGARKRAGELLDRFDLADAADRLVKTWSGGMSRRLNLIASVVVAPPVLFLDEPTTGLDPRSRTEIWRTVRELVAAGTTVLLTTQYLEEADRLADDIVIIDGGRAVATGSPDVLKDSIGVRGPGRGPRRAARRRGRARCVHPWRAGDRRGGPADQRTGRRHGRHRARRCAHARRGRRGSARRRHPPSDARRGVPAPRRPPDSAGGGSGMSTIPMTSTRSRPGVDGAAAAARVLWKLRHDPAGIVLTLAAPVVLVLVFGYIFGSAIAVPGSGDYREFLVPGLFATIAFNIIPSMITIGAGQRARCR